MKTLKNILATLTLITIAAVSVNAQNPNSEAATANASATIITPIEIDKTNDLLFGNIVASAAGGTVEITSDSDEPNYSGVSAPTGVEGTSQRALFLVTGLTDASFKVNLPTSSITLTGEDNSSNTMSVGTFTSNHTDATIDADGNEVYVGATLTVGANQTADTYTGSFEVTVAYE